MRYKTKIAALLLALLHPAFSESASALSVTDILVEPYAGYSFLGGSTLGPGNYFASSTGYGSYSGFTFGGRAGVQLFDVIFVALDGSYSPSLAFTNSSASGGVTLTPTAPSIVSGAYNTKLGVVAGVMVPVLGLRGWLGYQFLDQLGGAWSTTLTGFSFKAGASMPILLFFNLNLEYITSYYSKFSPQGGPNADNPAGTLSNSHILLSLSAPITF